MGRKEIRLRDRNVEKYWHCVETVVVVVGDLLSIHFWHESPLVVLACESLHVYTVCIWRCEHARFCMEVFYALYINFHSFIHSFIHSSVRRRG